MLCPFQSITMSMCPIVGMLNLITWLRLSARACHCKVCFPHWWFISESVTYYYGNFLFSHSFHHYQLAFFYKDGLSFTCSSWNYFLNISMDLWNFIFIKCVITYSCNLFWCPNLANGSLFEFTSVCVPINFLSTSLLSGTERFFRLTPFSGFGISHFSKKPCFLSVENGT